MLFGKKFNVVGLDIGSRTIKAGEIVETKSGPTLKSFGSVDLPPGAIDEGNIIDPALVADSIRQLFKRFGIKESNAAISIGGYSVIVKKITVQTMEEDELQETINLEAEQYIPFDISDVNLDFQILGENEHNPNQMNVLLVAAKKEMINDYVRLIQMAKLNPCVIDIDAFALQNIYENAYLAGAPSEGKPEEAEGQEEGENVALIDIGASKTSLNILKDRSSVFMRDVSLGCGQINSKIMQMVDCSPEEAEELKFSPDPERISPEDLREIISSVVADWCTEIRRALDFFYSTYPDDHIQKIVLSGGGGNIGEFRELLAVETSADVETINPFSGLYIDPDKFDSDYIQKMAPQAAICMGLALRKVDDK
ncbi:MAG: type IV pilus assembly protein PilM [Desulfobacterales bacterium]|jgi:type IV pilus assembly protein PilM